METNQKHFLYRLYLVAGILVFLGFGIGYKIFHIQYIDGNNYRQLAKNKTIQNFTISPERGNIFSDDGSLLAASTTSFDVYFDAVTVSDVNFSKYSKQLSEKLSETLNKSKDFYLNSLNSAKNNNKRYHLIQRGVSIENLNKIKQMPLFKMGGIRGGLIIEKKNSRDYPLNKIAERTIGYERILKDDNFSGVGLEHAFGSKLRGKNGIQLMQKISNGKWKPISSNSKIEPVPGTDIISTINVGFQDITHHSLLKQLEDFEADHGSAVVMETATGEIKAISNLGRTKEGKYYEKLNYAVGEHFEPGSTFKLMSVIAAFEDDKVELNSIIDTEKGVLSFYGNKVRDSKPGGYGKISVNDAFKFSSNTGIVKIITESYGKEPHKFSDRLYNMGLSNKLGVSILGESSPKIPHPNDKNWNGLSLPWMAYGYGVLLSPLQILTFYNSVANNGEMVKPVFIKQSNLLSNKIVLNPSICSEDTLDKVKLMLENVVNEEGGTGNNIKSNIYKIAGKTGTGQVDYSTENMQYISSFVGYFPADKPKYSCIVVIHKPNKKKGYYGSTVAAPVFKKIADKIYSLTPKEINYNKAEKFNSSLIYSKSNYPLIDINNLSAIKGKNYKNILPALENLGFDVSFNGFGMIIKNFKIKSKSQKKNSYKSYMKLLKDILYKVEIQSVLGSTDININKIEFNSKNIVKNDLFIAIRGFEFDGNSFISNAISGGAKAIICNAQPSKIIKGVTYIIVNDSRKTLALISSNYYDNPSKKIKLIGITGTNGKTSSSSLMYQLFKSFDKKVGLISTNVILVNDNKFSTNQTTPDSLFINYILSEMVVSKVEYCFMEVSSHAISQMRIFGLSFDIGIFTNLTHDHLDYHKSFKDYRDVKKIFFDTLPKSAFAITNVDDKNGDYMVQNTICKTITYSLKSNSDFSLKILEKDFNGMKLLINDIEFWTKLTGSFNAYNILTVFCVAKVFNISDELILKKISSLNSPEGRFELINSNSDKIGIIDYAHSPDSLKQVLKTINDLKNSNDSLITVVGCGGDRDKEKRPLMGKIACSLSDKVIFTSDNPRFEDPEIIINQMKNGVENKDKHKIILELNRKKAIQEACELANKSDIILIAGKGHEKYQIKGDEKIEFNDKKILIETLKINK